MPEICRFQGIRITMYHNEHGLPHFHARCGGMIFGGWPPNANRYPHRSLVINSRYDDDH